MARQVQTRNRLGKAAQPEDLTTLAGGMLFLFFQVRVFDVFGAFLIEKAVFQRKGAVFLSQKAHHQRLVTRHQQNKSRVFSLVMQHQRLEERVFSLVTHLQRLEVAK